ncbi:ciliary microtubule associated protein 1B [Sphaeramia orbicularis]|uniref:Outer dense fiber protein 3-like n=1 Tax=Sphaeramia orbicularis TaxID=375764 RepID=A0A673AGQ2_9TELE|nr:outer dense fiber protein 3-like [Sphaeramia orbicularis]
MTSADPWVGTWRPHRPKGPIAALHGSPGPAYALPGLTGGERHDPTKNKAPVISLGKRYELPSFNCSPGPKYLVPANVSKTGRHGTPAFSLHSRLKSPKVVKTPGPGHYSPEPSGKSVFRSCPAYSVCGRSKDMSRDETPGPGSYNLPTALGCKTVVTSAAPAHSISSRSKIGGFNEDLKKSPGPAAYKVVDSCIFKSKPPQYSMTGRNFTPSPGANTPGPGSHNPGKVTFTKAKAPCFSFGLRHSEYILPVPNVAE